MKRSNDKSNQPSGQSALEFARRTAQRRIRTQTATSSEHAVTFLSNATNRARLQLLSSIIQEALDLINEPDYMA
jgi:hypothetical protein